MVEGLLMEKTLSGTGRSERISKGREGQGRGHEEGQHKQGRECWGACGLRQLRRVFLPPPREAHICFPSDGANPEASVLLSQFRQDPAKTQIDN